MLSFRHLRISSKLLVASGILHPREVAA